MKNNKIQEKIRDILNEEMYNYGQAKDIGEKDEIFDRTSNQILELFKQSSKFMTKEEIKKVGLKK